VFWGGGVFEIGSGIIQTQESFLNGCIKDRIKVTVFLLKGPPLIGTIKGVDAFSILLETEGGQSLVFKQAIASIVPEKNVKLG
jgi:host factor-I protein